MKWTKPLCCAGLLLGLIGCGSGGAEPGAGAGQGAKETSGVVPDQPVENPGSGTDPVGTWEDSPGCAGDSSITTLAAIDAIWMPLCRIANQCPSIESDDSASPSAQPGSASAVRSQVMAAMSSVLGPQDTAPSYCGELLDLQGVGESGNAVRAVCEALTRYRAGLAAHPECNQLLTLPEGTCASAAFRCGQELAAKGCAADFDALPKACSGIVINQSSSDEAF